MRKSQKSEPVKAAAQTSLVTCVFFMASAAIPGQVERSLKFD